MIYDWYKIFNKDEFEALNLVSKNYQLELQDRSLKNILVTKGITLGVFVDDIFLSLELNNKEPFEFEGMAIDIDANNDVYIGYAVEDDE